MGKLLQKNIGNPLQKISNSLFYNCDTLPHQKTLTRLGKTSHENTPPCKSGGFHLKGYEMKKYYPLDFDEKGKAVLGNAKNTPAPMRGTPAIYVESGSDEGKNGLKSISISPAITTTPALDSLFPIYWDDLTEEEKAEGKKTVLVNADNLTVGDTYTAQVAATGDWYVIGDGEWSAQGGSATYEDEVTQMGDDHVARFIFGACADPEDENAEYFELAIGITTAGRQHSAQQGTTHTTASRPRLK